MNKFLLLFTCLYLSACDLDLGSSYDPTTRTMYVDYYQEACDENSNSLCLRTRFDTDDAFKVNQISMSGFENLQWGSRYTLQVEAERDGNGKDTHYRLEGIDSTTVIEASNNEFVLTFNMVSGILQDNQNNSWTIAAEKVFSCVEADCTLLANSYRDEQKIQLSFTAEDNLLTLLKVTCQSSVTDFSSVCEGINDDVFEIAHYQSDCGLPEPRLCLVYKDDAAASTEWNILPFKISGFTAQWGQQYKLDVKVKIEAKALKSVEFVKESDPVKDRTNDKFKMIMRTGNLGLEASNNDVISYSGIEFNCSRFNQCNDIDNTVAKATSNSDSLERFLILQAFVETNAETPVIVIEKLLCDAGGMSKFTTECISEHNDVYWIE
ncbi:MAG: hypothetical protein ACI9OH_001610 [Oleispira sp.]|jgi:hypothetical protein